MTTSKYTPKDILRFWSKAAITANPDKCWEWIAGCNPKTGYGRFSFHYQSKDSHRFAWELTNGEIPNGLWVLHKCDNRRCVNPKHLFLGTHQDNMDDMKAKGHQTSGEKNRQSKLTRQQVNEIRERYSRGDILQRELAVEYGVVPSQIGHIVNGKSW